MNLIVVTIIQVLLVSSSVWSAQAISNACLQCICLVESGCTEDIRCGDGGDSCGPYQIQEKYWKDAGRPENDYEPCVKKFQCAETTVRAYMRRYATFGRLGHSPTCEDYARIHNGGPYGFRHSSTDYYWGKIKRHGCDENS